MGVMSLRGESERKRGAQREHHNNEAAYEREQ